ncbi:MAG: potassium:proton antiporter, partial [Pseudomonadota bacterium]|nr:potassium:proton antiporter [Pseudomonadota bacterium]
MLKHVMRRGAIKPYCGYSLTELLVACGLASIVISAVATQAARSHIAHSSIQHATSVEDDIRALQSTITQHLSKAGFVYSSNPLSPFGATTIENTVFEVTTGHRANEPENSCVTF